VTRRTQRQVFLLLRSNGVGKRSMSSGRLLLLLFLFFLLFFLSLPPSPLCCTPERIREPYDRGMGLCESIKPGRERISTTLHGSTPATDGFVVWKVKERLSRCHEFRLCAVYYRIGGCRAMPEQRRFSRTSSSESIRRGQPGSSQVCT